jgi:transposase
VPQDWYERYALRIEEFRLPKGEAKRQALVEQIGQDGWHLLTWIRADGVPEWLRAIPAVEILRRVWVQQFWMQEGHLHFRSNDHIPPSSLLISSPYDPGAHLSIKRETVWTGYKVHVTETCDDELAHLIIHVETTPATTQDIEMTSVIHQGLERKHLLPGEHLMDTGYVDGDHIVRSQKQYGVEVLGPVVQPGNWQAKADQGFDHSHFQIDWENKQVTCPQGTISKKWTVRQDADAPHVPYVIRAQFGKQDCLACPVRVHWTRTAVNPRQITFRRQEHYEALQAARKRQTTLAFKERYTKRSGIEGTISQGVRAFDLRRCRYLGRAKTHLQHILTATAINVVHLFQWQMGDTPSELLSVE